MNRTGRTTALVTAILTAGCGLTAWGADLVARATSDLTRTTAVAPAEPLVVGVAGLGMAAAGVWSCLGTFVCLVDLARRRTILAPGPLRPRALRQALLRAWAPTVGAAVVCAAGPVAADTGPDGLPLPDRPVVTAPADHPAERGRSRAAPRHDSPARVGAPAERTVVPGDCLWTIAADLLGPTASPAQVDRAWRAVYHLNHSRVGPDPDVLRPGTRLALPRSLRQSLPPSR